jgi:hypothetical protein
LWVPVFTVAGPTKFISPVFSLSPPLLLCLSLSPLGYYRYDLPLPEVVAATFFFFLVCSKGNPVKRGPVEQSRERSGSERKGKKKEEKKERRERERLNDVLFYFCSIFL